MGTAEKSLPKLPLIVCGVSCVPPTIYSPTRYYQTIPTSPQTLRMSNSLLAPISTSHRRRLGKPQHTLSHEHHPKVLSPVGADHAHPQLRYAFGLWNVTSESTRPHAASFANGSSREVSRKPPKISHLLLLLPRASYRRVWVGEW